MLGAKSTPYGTRHVPIFQLLDPPVSSGLPGRCMISGGSGRDRTGTGRGVEVDPPRLAAD